MMLPKSSGCFQKASWVMPFLLCLVSVVKHICFLPWPNTGTDCRCDFSTLVTLLCALLWQTLQIQIQCKAESQIESQTASLLLSQKQNQWNYKSCQLGKTLNATECEWLEQMQHYSFHWRPQVLCPESQRCSAYQTAVRQACQCSVLMLPIKLIFSCEPALHCLCSGCNLMHLSVTVCEKYISKTIITVNG